MEKKLKIAIQKSGRLNEESIRLIEDCGISIDLGHNQLKLIASNFPLELFFLSNKDIPQYVEDGISDIAIVGENLLLEKSHKVDVLQQLGLGKCRVSLAVPKNVEYKGLNYFNNKKFATSYPNTLKRFLQKNNINAEIHEISGSVEIAPNIGLSDAICDIVSTGSTLFKNRLMEVEVLHNCEAILIGNQNITSEVMAIRNKFLFRINAVLAARNNKYVLLNAPKNKLDNIVALLPGLKSPTILSLADTDWCSLHSVISVSELWGKIDALKSNGAQGILVLDIELMVA